MGCEHAFRHALVHSSGKVLLKAATKIKSALNSKSSMNAFLSSSLLLEQVFAKWEIISFNMAASFKNLVGTFKMFF